MKKWFIICCAIMLILVGVSQAVSAAELSEIYVSPDNPSTGDSIRLNLAIYSSIDVWQIKVKIYAEDFGEGNEIKLLEEDYFIYDDFTKSGDGLYRLSIPITCPDRDSLFINIHAWKQPEGTYLENEDKLGDWLSKYIPINRETSSSDSSGSTGSIDLIPIFSLIMIVVIILGIIIAVAKRKKSPKPPPLTNQPQQTQQYCSGCGNPLSWMSQHNRWYCNNCKQYK